MSEDRQRAMLAYTRAYGWVVIEPDRIAATDPPFYWTRAAKKRIFPSDILAKAELPPLPESAA